eukprot:7155738-Heterocapsa_arctica.AAC.1
MSYAPCISLSESIRIVSSSIFPLRALLCLLSAEVSLALRCFLSASAIASIFPGGSSLELCVAALSLS